MAASNQVNKALELSQIGMGIRKVSQRVKYSDFTDGGGLEGTLTLGKQIPAGAFVIGTKVTVEEGFTGDTSAVLKLGKSSGEDEFTDGTSVNVFAAGTVGDSAEDPLEFISSDTSVYAEITSGSDWGKVTAGQALIEVFYLSTEAELTDGHPGRNQ